MAPTPFEIGTTGKAAAQRLSRYWRLLSHDTFNKQENSERH